MSKKDQTRTHNWKKRVKDWLIVPHSAYENPHQVTLDELAKHKTRLDCWVAIDGVVYDVTRFVPYHPGGPKILEMYAGGDATTAFTRNHMNVPIMECIPSCRVGVLVANDGPSSVSVEPPPPPYPAAPPVATKTTVATPSTSSVEGTAPHAEEPSASSSSSTAPDGNSSSIATMTPAQLLAVAAKSRLFEGIPHDVVVVSAEQAMNKVAEGTIDDATALKELFACLDVEERGYIKRIELRDFLYRLDPQGACEEMLIRAPDQITLPIFQRILKQL